MTSADVYSQVNTHYSGASKDTSDGSYGDRVAREFGYSTEELANVPQEANLGLSCGNPFAIAHLKEGETVVDLGSGAGFDAFQAAKKVGKSGKSIGVDMNDDMLQRAEQIKVKLGSNNVEFVKSSITKINLPDSSADCIISNCVINLVPDNDKQLVFNEMYRVLKPGGRVAISDILAKKQLPARIKDSMALYVGCIAGASQVSEYEEYLEKAGFADSLIVNSKGDLNAYRQDAGLNVGCCAPTQAAPEDSAKGGCCGPAKSCKPAQAETVSNFDDINFNEFAGSYKIFAIKT